MLPWIAACTAIAPSLSVTADAVATPSAMVVPTVSIAAEPVTFLPVVAVPLEDDKPSFSYTFVEANYLWTDLDAIDESLDGWEVRASLELFLNFFVQGSYAQVKDQEDLHLYRVGLGWHFDLGNTLDVYGIVSAAGVELEDSVNNFDEDGLAAEAGARFLLTDKLELNGRGLWEDIEDSEVGAGLGARWYLTHALSIGVNADSIDSTETYAAGIRFQF